MNLKALKVCKECFNDDELRGYIISQKQPPWLMSTFQASHTIYQVHKTNDA